MMQSGHFSDLYRIDHHHCETLIPLLDLLIKRDCNHGVNDIVICMAGWILKLAQSEPELVQVAIEVPHGPVVDSLLNRGFQLLRMWDSKSWSWTRSSDMKSRSSLALPCSRANGGSP